MRLTKWGVVSLLLLDIVVAALSVTCKQQQRGRQEPGPNPAPSYTNNAASGNDLSKHPIPATPVSSDPDPPTVEVLSVAIQKQPGLNQYMVTAQLSNRGPGTANISGGCNWQCPEGLILKGGAQVVSGGYLVQDRQIPYSGIANGMCAGPPAFLQLNCSLEIRGYDVNDHVGNRARTVNWNGQVSVR